MVRLPASRVARSLVSWAGPLWLAAVVSILGLFSGSARAARPEGERPAKGNGIVVVAPVSEAPVDAAALYALAQAIYREPTLRPSALDDTRARALLGQSVAPAAATADSARFSELRDGVRDDGAVSRSVLGTMATSTRATAVAVVRPGETPGHVQIRLFLAESASFDVSLYDGEATDPAWRTEVVRALLRRFDPNAVAPTAVPTKKVESSTGARAFYKSPWLWAALGGAVLLGGTALVVSQVRSNEDVLVRVEPPASGVAPSSLGFFRFGSVSP